MDLDVELKILCLIEHGTGRVVSLERAVQSAFFVMQFAPARRGNADQQRTINYTIDPAHKVLRPTPP
jgi:hypothetical protein